MGVDAACLAEIVFRSSRMKLIDRQVIFALDKGDICELRRDGYCTAHPAKGTGATAY